MQLTLKFISTQTRRTVSQVFYDDSGIKSSEGTEKRDPESPASFLDFIQVLIDSLEPKTNLLYFDDGNLSDDYRTVLKDLKKIVEAEKTLGLKLKTRNAKSFSLVTSLKNND